MPGKKKVAESLLRSLADERRASNVILEEMRSLNRLTIEAVEASRSALERQIVQVDEDARARDADLGLALRQNGVDIQGIKTDLQRIRADIKQNSTDIRQNSADIRQNTLDIQRNSAEIRQNSADIQQNSADIRELAAKVGTLARLEERVSALERPSA